MPARAAALAAEKARVDAIAPLLYLEVDLSEINIVESGQDDVNNYYEWRRPASYLPNIRIDITVTLVRENVGAAPAQLGFGDTSWFIEGLQVTNTSGLF